MSRIGKLPIPVPAGVDVKIDGSRVTVKGPEGILSRTVSEDMLLAVESGTVQVTRPSDAKKHRSLHGLTRTLINNMVVGVTSGYEKSLDLVGIGYRANKQGNKLVLAVGYSHPVEVIPEEGIEIEVPAPNKVIIRGIDKEKVGQLAANIRKIREPEPYKGKGIRYSGETVRIKAGKAGKKK
jgi:large subunit ribosomal protein L6